ncbi:MAG: cytochrome c oxidase assembly protein [Synoicihabitans sp.]
MELIDLRHWHNEPYLIGGLLLLVWGYALAVGPLRGFFGRTEPVPRWRQTCYYGSLILFYLAVGSPFDQLGERFLFSAHMAQHVILIYPCAIMLLLGLPSDLIDGVIRRLGIFQKLGWFFTRPLVAATLYVLTQSLWHFPALYDLALQDRFIHVLEHLTFFSTAVLFWWSVVTRSQLWPPLKLPSQLIYLFATAIAFTPLFAFVTFSNEILYPTYEFAPRLIEGFSPMDDQLLAGAIMKLSNVVVTLAGFTVIFLLWYRQSERANQT